MSTIDVATATRAVDALLHWLSVSLVGVARAIRVVDTKAGSSASSQSGQTSYKPSANGAVQPDSPDLPSPGTQLQRGTFQVLTAHDNGQVQVWEAALGSLQPEFRIGQPGPSAR